MRTGTYVFGSSLSFGAGNEDKTFELTGGWNSDCSARVINPASTIMTAATPGAMNYFFQGNQRHFRIEGIRFENFGSFSLLENVCPAAASCASTETVRVRYNHFRNGRHVRVHAHDAQTYVVANNLFEGLTGQSLNSTEPATIDLKYAVEDSIPQVIFNTFSIACTSSKPGLQIHSQKLNSLFSHNILATSGCSTTFRVDSDDSGKAWRFRNNLYPVVNSGIAPVAGSSGDLIGANPQFVSSSDFHLRETAPVSPAINAGQTPVQAGQDQLAVPAQDLDGPAGVRLVGTKFDMGAFESAVSNSQVITVTNKNDSGTGSLREAIVSANATAGPQKIEFNLPTCNPAQVIFLQSPLPDVTDTLEIDGFSQPGASPNTLSIGSDSVICLIISGLNQTLAQAIRVPDSVPSGVSLTVKGLAFSTFLDTVVIRLQGGSGHRIQGNFIGGKGPGNLNLLSVLAGIRVHLNAQSVLIGGPEAEDRNSFGDATSSAIILQDASSTNHVVQNNYIGLAPDGMQISTIGASGGGNGIFASNTPGVKILDNVISAVPNGNAILITGATATGYEIGRNKLGTSASGVALAQYRNGTGISIANGSGGHMIGGLGNVNVSNTIANTAAAGVHLQPSAGSGTTIRPNRIFANGIDGSGLGIDIGQLGALPNDAGDGDGGPNNGQNKPVITGSVVNPDGSREVSGVLSTMNGSHLVDIYRSPDCPGGRGNMLNLVGTETVNVVLLGSAAFTATIPGGTPGVLTAVATRISNGDTSEASDCFFEANETTTAITTDSPDPSQFGQGINVGVIVTSPSGGTPSGSVTISGPGGSQCTANLNGGVGSCQLTSTTVSAGILEITAEYSGDASFLPSSDTEAHVFSAAATVTTITSDAPDPSQVGQPYTVQVEVRRQHDNTLAGGGGTVTVSDGSGQTCMGDVTGGLTSCQLTSVTAGSKILTATFGGNAFHTASSGTQTHTVLPAATTTTITSDAPDPSAVGESYTVAVTVAANPGAGQPVGTVAVNDGSGASCMITLANASGSCQLTSTSPGAKTLTASYSSSGQAFANSADTEPHQVGPAATTTTITSDAPDPSLVGQPYTVAVTVAAAVGTPTGGASISDGSGASCTATLSAGAGSCQLTSTSAGAKTLTASYAGQGSFASSSDTEPHQVNSAGPAPTMTDITVHTPNPSRVGEPFTVGITVTSDAGTPTGNFTIDAGLGGQSCQGTLSNGSGSCQLTYPNVASGLLTACKQANATFAGSCDGEVHMSIKADTSLDLGAFVPDPVNVGSALTTNVGLSVVAPGAGMPTGTILVAASATEQCTITLPATQCQLVLTTVGSRNIDVSYPGDANFNGTNRSTMVNVVIPPDELFANGFE